MDADKASTATDVAPAAASPRPTSRSMAGDVALTMATNIAMAAIGFATGPLAARLLGPEGRGELAAIQMWPVILATFAMVGMPESLIYFSARSPSRAGTFLGSAVGVALLTSIPFLVLGYVLMPLLLSAQAPGVVDASRAYLLIIPVYALVFLLPNPLRGTNDMVAWNVLRPGATTCWLLVLGYAALFDRQPEPFSLARGYLIALGLLFFPMALVVWRRIRSPLRVDPSAMPGLLRFGLPAELATAPRVLNARLDQALMAAFIAPQLLGFYVVAVAWSHAVSPILNAIGLVIFPRIARTTGADDQGATLTRAARFGAALALVTGALLLASTPLALPWIFGEDFAAAVPAACLLVVAGAVGGVNSILAEGAKGLGHPTYMLTSELVGLGVAAAILVVLLGPLGILGAAVASLCGGVVRCAVLLVLCSRSVGQPVGSFLLPQPGDARLAWAIAQRFRRSAHR